MSQCGVAFLVCWLGGNCTATFVQGKGVQPGLTTSLCVAAHRITPTLCLIMARIGNET